ncbi:MAG: 4-(cytidine 5'-diphospho)-2-C-methyl-D-erythritol kinase [Candidatus Omnitrophica bacterium]|nr:4-(cytidine 5'-diphospho)-2-C-methyl-D-erythritol kinase [Candidatus Omnitrophota bacterium]
MSFVVWPAYAKVNLHLAVLGKRRDGTHELLTVFERIDLADRLKIEWIPARGVEIRCSHPGVPCDASNLAARAAEVFLRAARIRRGVRITIEKKIPVAAGLGGGSSDAAAALLGLSKLSGRKLAKEKLLDLAKGLGADVPFFLAQTPFALGRGRGDEIKALPWKARLWHLIVFPRFAVPTRSVYQAFALTAPAPDARLLFCALKEKRLSQVRDHLFNALEPTVEALYPAIRDVKSAVERKGGLPHPMVSGSGSTVFALGRSRRECLAAAGKLAPKASGWQVLVCATKE